MKYIFLFISLVILACSSTDKTAVPTNDVAQDQKAHTALKDSGNYTSIEWLDPVVQNLGTIKKGQVTEISWRFKNTGSKPLLIADIHAGCGCTTPDPPKEPIAPGAESVIKAKFNSESFTGHVSKDVFVEANNSNRNNDANNKLSFTADIKE